MRFTKMQGIGNDFVVIDRDVLSPDRDLPDLAIRACDRHFGIGADGLLVLSRDEGSGPAFSMRMFNPDGTEDMCGNGLRCAGLWAHRTGWVTSDTPFSVASKEGLKAIHIVHSAEDHRSAWLKVGMGLPKFAPADIPFCAPPGIDRVAGYPLRVDGQVYEITALNTGSTHTVIFGEKPPSDETFERVSPLIENHPLFPDRTSVLWATPQGDHTIAVRIWERGVGETLGCGTGACAVGVAAHVGGTVAVISKGGTLEIAWPGEKHEITMFGPAEIVFDGDFSLAHF